MYPNPNPNPNPNSNSSQSHHQTSARAAANHLTRYSSAPSSVFESSDVILGALQSNGADKYGNSSGNDNSNGNVMGGFAGPMSSSRGGGVSSNLTMSIAGGGGVGSPQHLPSSGLTRHSSSPAGFLQHLTASDAGFILTKGGESYNIQQPSHAQRQSRLCSQLSFTNQGDHSSLKRASSSSSHSNRPSNGFSISPWEDGHSLVFGASSSKRPKNVSDELLNSLSAMDSQIDLSEMMHIPEDSVACKVRAKRGCATHPRSIAERERRTRISGKLKKLQELVPNMDKQTSYSEMLDLAIQHIAGLQFQIQASELVSRMDRPGLLFDELDSFKVISCAKETQQRSE